MERVSKDLQTEPKDQLETGVFCVHVGDYLLSPICPLKSGSCMWQHRQAPKCTYDPEFAKSNFTVAEYCERVGIPTPTNDTVNTLREKMIAEVRKALTE